MQNRFNLIIFLITIFINLNSIYGQSEKDWWQKTVFYQIYPRSFYDTNGDGIGDLKGITSKLEYLKETGIGATWLSPIFESPMKDFGYDISNYMAIQPEYGTMDDFDELIEKANKLGIKIILDFVPNHTSDQCEWFLKSVNQEPDYEDFYIWHPGFENPNSTSVERLPPNNWQSVFYGSAWTFHPERNQFYLHQFTKEQPDLNFRNPLVVERMKDVIRFWLTKGVAGFRIDAVNHLFEVTDFRNEPETGTDLDPLSYGFTHHYYTKDLPEVYEMIYEWRKLLDDWKEEYGGDTRIMMTEAYANLTFTMKYYQSDDGSSKGSHMPFNFLLITDLDIRSTAQDFVFVINKWLTYMDRDNTANWVMGNHDQSRVASRFGFERIDALNILLMTLPGIAITYNGEEIGMVDYRDISWEDTKDPAALNTNPHVYMKFSRDPERTPFQWNNLPNAGFSTSTKTWLPVHPNYKSLNLKAQTVEKPSHYKLYKELVALRHHDTFLYGNIHILPYNKNVFAYLREHAGNDTFVVVINLSKSREIVNLQTLFPSLSEKLKVVTSSTRSSYKSGDLIKTNDLILQKYNAIVLKDDYRRARNSAISFRLTSISNVFVTNLFIVLFVNNFLSFFLF
uniref:alpha-glucosidase n=1 Tax=Corethrella appendiculata TaxID=1370023 RepID=U5EX75_9DIPT